VDGSSIPTTGTDNSFRQNVVTVKQEDVVDTSNNTSVQEGGMMSVRIEEASVDGSVSMRKASSEQQQQQEQEPEHNSPPAHNNRNDDTNNQQTHLRPKYVRDLLLQQEQYLERKQQLINANTSMSSVSSFDTPLPTPPPIIYYFGLGSNMLRSKLENRGNGFGASNPTTNVTTAANSTTTTTTSNKIDIISMEPAYIKNYRLSFNLRGFCPLEPGMGSLEPIDHHDNNDDNNNKNKSNNRGNSKPLHTYEEPECHGALIALTMDNYEKVMQSEGVGPNVTNPSYEEIVITAIPYNTSRGPVTAIALRAREHVRLRHDPSPSQRYMDILRQGAAELQLRDNYQTFLQTHPVQQTPPWLQRLAVYNLICTMTVSSKFKWRGLSKLQSFFLYKVYIPSGVPHIQKWQRTFSNIGMGTILFPGACIGRILQWYCTIFKKEHSPMMQRFISMMDIRPNSPASEQNGGASQ
jgi:hypothetical protein